MLFRWVTILLGKLPRLEVVMGNSMSDEENVCCVGHIADWDIEGDIVLLKNFKERCFLFFIENQSFPFASLVALHRKVIFFN